MTRGRPSRTRATRELVVPRSMPIGRGGALGSKISSSAMGSCLSMKRGFLDRGDLVEEAPQVPELAQVMDQLAGGLRRGACTGGLGRRARLRDPKPHC